MTLLRSMVIVTAVVSAAAAVQVGARQSDTTRESSGGRPVVVASKPFGESYVLCEMFAQVLEAAGIPVDRRPGLGATEVAFAALRSDAIDVFPEYTGTALVAILHLQPTPEQRSDPRAVYGAVARAFADQWRIRWLPPLGFQNTYAIAVRRDTAARYSLRTLSDLARAGSELRAGFTPDFIARDDGLPGLVASYGLRLRELHPLSTAVKYESVASGAVDVIDGYSTDGLLARYDLVTLVDDRHFFPPYEAAVMVSAALSKSRPDAIAALTLLSGRLDETQMRALNRRVEVDGEDVRTVARDALTKLGLTSRAAALETARLRNSGDSFVRYLWERRSVTASLLLRHVALVVIALGAAILLAVPLGLALERARGVAEAIIAVLGVLQTVPSLAMLAFMIPLLGVGVRPALVALWLYALYPIARNTYVGVRDADPAAVEAAEALGTTAAQRLLLVRLPIAAPVIMAGVRTAAVITVGAATLAAFIGAGGLGEPIATGLALADTPLILSGALPAAALALGVDAALAGVERALTPRHLRRV